MKSHNKVTLMPKHEPTSERENERAVFNKLRRWADLKTSVNKYILAKDIDKAEEELLNAITGHDYAFGGRNDA